MGGTTKIDRREFITSAVLVTSAALLGNAPALALAREKKEKTKGVEEVSPVEDLMREHGGLRRILLIYDEALRRIRSKQEMDLTLLTQSAKLVHDFIESYHEKLEEQFLFPRLKKAHRLVETVDILLAQHAAGRRLTAKIVNSKDLTVLSSAMTGFSRMYRAHAAREDTVVFPEFKKLLSPKEYDKLGDEFEAREHQLFGRDGFEGVVARIADIEKALGIADLAKYTPAG